MSRRIRLLQVAHRQPDLDSAPVHDGPSLDAEEHAGSVADVREETAGGGGEADGLAGGHEPARSATKASFRGLRGLATNRAINVVSP